MKMKERTDLRIIATLVLVLVLISMVIVKITMTSDLEQQSVAVEMAEDNKSKYKAIEEVKTESFKIRLREYPDGHRYLIEVAKGSNFEDLGIEIYDEAGNVRLDLEDKVVTEINYWNSWRSYYDYSYFKIGTSGKLVPKVDTAVIGIYKFIYRFQEKAITKFVVVSDKNKADAKTPIIPTTITNNKKKITKGPSSDRKKPSGNSNNKKKPSDDGKKPSDDGKKPSDDGKKPSDDGKKPSDDEKKPEDDKEDPEYESKVPKNLTAVYGQTFGEIINQLPEGFCFEDTLTTKVGPVGQRSVTLTYIPDDTSRYNIVKGIRVTLTVNKATPKYESPQVIEAVYGDTWADVKLPKGFEPMEGNNNVGNAGVREIKLRYIPEDSKNYLTVEGITVKLIVEKAVPAYTIPSNLTGVKGDRLNKIELPSGYTFKNPSKKMESEGEHVFTMIFTPKDKENYRTMEFGVTVRVKNSSDPDKEGESGPGGGDKPADKDDSKPSRPDESGPSDGNRPGGVTPTEP